MDYNTPAPYKNYLPSKKMQIIISVIVLAIILYVAIPFIVRTIKHHNSTSSGPTPAITFGLPTGNPTTRDSNGNGIPDWELIAVGINPSDPDAQAKFEKVKNKMSATALTNLENQTTDADKISLTTGGVLDKDAAANQGITGDNVNQATASEVLNYINGISSKNTKYSLADLTVVDSNLANATAYQVGIKNISFVNLVSKTVWQHISGYIKGTEDATATTKILTQMKASVESMKALPVPMPIAQNDLDAINALSGLYQTLNNYDATKSSDQAYQFGTVGALQSYIHDYIIAEGEIQLYIPVAMDPKNYGAQ